MKSRPEANETMRSVKIRVYPDATQKAALKQIFGIVRVVGNQGLDEMFVRGHPKNWQSLRNKIVTASNVPEEEQANRPWLYDGNLCSSSIKVEAIHKLVSTIKATEESLKAQNKEFKYQMSRKQKKDSRKSFSFYPGGAYAIRCVESTSTRKGTKKKNFGLKLPLDALRNPLQVISKNEFQRAKSIIEDEIERKGSDEYKRLV
ncbi:hypothetical protein MP638_000746 [Amoeboaphelidium occidentale]|nr:hypothetical protein MP638_000746 [Amoeboaphelidium occidentale]